MKADITMKLRGSEEIQKCRYKLQAVWNWIPFLFCCRWLKKTLEQLLLATRCICEFNLIQSASYLILISVNPHLKLKGNIQI